MAKFDNHKERRKITQSLLNYYDAQYGPQFFGRRLVSPKGRIRKILKVGNEYKVVSEVPPDETDLFIKSLKDEPEVTCHEVSGNALANWKVLSKTVNTKFPDPMGSSLSKSTNKKATQRATPEPSEDDFGPVASPFSFNDPTSSLYLTPSPSTPLPPFSDLVPPPASPTGSSARLHPRISSAPPTSMAKRATVQTSQMGSARRNHGDTEVTLDDLNTNNQASFEYDISRSPTISVRDSINDVDDWERDVAALQTPKATDTNAYIAEQRAPSDEEAPTSPIGSTPEVTSELALDILRAAALKPRSKRSSSALTRLTSSTLGAATTASHGSQPEQPGRPESAPLYTSAGASLPPADEFGLPAFLSPAQAQLQPPAHPQQNKPTLSMEATPASPTSIALSSPTFGIVPPLKCPGYRDLEHLTAELHLLYGESTVLMSPRGEHSPPYVPLTAQSDASSQCSQRRKPSRLSSAGLKKNFTYGEHHDYTTPNRQTKNRRPPPPSTRTSQLGANSYPNNLQLLHGEITSRCEQAATSKKTDSVEVKYQSRREHPARPTVLGFASISDWRLTAKRVRPFPTVAQLRSKRTQASPGQGLEPSARIISGILTAN